MAGWTTNGMAQVTAGAPYSLVGARALVAADTEAASGMSPQSVAAAAAQVAMLALAMAHNTQTSTAGAATSNTLSGQIVTEALTTAPGATYTMTLTNSNVTAVTPALLVSIGSGSNTVPGIVLTSVTNGSGSSVFVFTNNGTAALNGTMVIGWSL